MKRITWELQQILNALGLMGLAGLAALVLAAFFYFAAIKPAKLEINNIRHEMSMLGNHAAIVRQHAPEEDLALFYNFFPKRDALSEQLRTIHRLAAEKKLSIPSVQYKLAKIQGTPLVSYQISFSVNSDYISLRRYIAAVLQALPNAAVEAVELQREDAEAEMLDEKIGLVLFFQDVP